MKNLITNTILVFLLLTALGSCTKEPNPGGTAVQNLAGEWWVRMDNGASYYNFSTYNTAANTADSMWVDDDNNAKSFWDIKGKVTTNAANRTFFGTNVANVDYTSSFTITNGKVIPKAATAPGSGDKTDSIYFEIQFSDDPAPGTVHKVEGYKRTGFSQDDH